jgi:hypothetical protein
MNAPNDKPAPESPAATPQRSASRAGAAITTVRSSWSRLPMRLRRGVLWSLVTLVLLLTIFRVTLPWIVPSVLRKVASGYGLTCEYERLELSLLGGDAGLWNLKLSPIEGATRSSPQSTRACSCRRGRCCEAGCICTVSSPTAGRCSSTATNRDASRCSNVCCLALLPAPQPKRPHQAVQPPVQRQQELPGELPGAGGE